MLLEPMWTPENAQTGRTQCVISSSGPSRDPGSRNFQKLIYLYPYLLTIQIEYIGISGNELCLKISKAQKVLKGNFLSDQYKLKYTLKLILVFLISRHKSGSLFTFTSSTKQRKLYLKVPSRKIFFP